MGHRRFGGGSQVNERKIASKEENYSCTRKIPVPNNFEEMVLPNGTRELTEEQMSEAQRCRDQFRDDVSRRMGELLLRGLTMLDAYCEVCNGILMENRNGVRNCVTCELYDERTKEGSRLVAEVPLDMTADGVTPGNVLLAEEKPQQGQNPVRIVDVARKTWAEGPMQNFVETSMKANESNSHDAVLVTTSRHNNFELSAHPSDEYGTVLLAVNRKLKWACEQLDHCENPSEIRELFALISEGINITKCLLGSR